MNKNKPYFSVIVPVHNKKPHLRRSINSILNQTFSDFELIIVDDASTDGSLDEIRTIEDARVILFNRENPGPGGYAARNFGIEKAKADYIAFLDADDEWKSDHLDNIYKSSIAFPSAGFFGAGWVVKDIEGMKPSDYFANKKKSKVHSIDLKKYLELCLNKMQPVWTSVSCIKRSLCDNLFPAGIAHRGGDRFAWVTVLAKTDMAWSPHIGAVYYRDSVNMVTRNASSTTRLPHLLIKRLHNKIEHDERVLLYKYCNHDIWDTYVSNLLQEKRQKVDLWKEFYWKNDFSYCFKRAVLSLIPNGIKRKIILLRNKMHE
jgi:glycosyltransferase involved in cell wall biosynthesis